MYFFFNQNDFFKIRKMEKKFFFLFNFYLIQKRFDIIYHNLLCVMMMYIYNLQFIEDTFTRRKFMNILLII